MIDQIIHRKVDICAIQETKTCEADEHIIKNHKLILLNSKSRHYGLGFVISPKIADFVVSYNSISDRVAYLDLTLQSRNGQYKIFRFVNANGPTSTLVKKTPKISSQFYSQLNKAINVPSRYELFVLGDFNSKLGTLSKADYEEGILPRHLGSYGTGKRNENGEALLNFLLSHDLFACNIAFQHPCRHRTTRVGFMPKPGRAKNSKETIPTFAQLDYILCRSKSRYLLNDARSYNNPRTVIKSDHKLVVAHTDLTKHVLIHRRRKRTTIRFDVPNLNNPSVKTAYQTCLEEELLNMDNLSTPDKRFEQLFESIKKSATTTVGTVKSSKPRFYSQDPQLMQLVEKRSNLRTSLTTDGKARDRSYTRTQINRTEKDIKRRLTDIKISRADNLCNTIENTDSSRQMFEAVRQLTDTKKSTKSVYVHNESGINICSDVLKAEKIKDYFKLQFTDPDGPLDPFDTSPKPLDVPITAEEVKTATQKLKNGKSNGPDNIPNELLKAWPPEYNNSYAEIINHAFSTNTHIPSIGQGLLSPLQKPGKPKGPIKSLRPLMLLNGSRKILSLIVLNRISSKIDNYTGPWQAAYKQSRSCADLVWAQRMLISTVKNQQWEFSKMGIDMSSAFDTIKRRTALNLLTDAGCTEDEVRLVRYLLANTTLQVKLKDALSSNFTSTLGAFQGDSLSGKLFTLVLAGALYDVRKKTGRSEPPISADGIPEQWEYADDVDYEDESIESLEKIFPQIRDILSDWNLFVNDTKTEFSRFYLAEQEEQDENGKSIRKLKSEKWRTNKALGSLLCSLKDIKNRCHLGNIAFSNYQKCWLNGPNIPLCIKIRLYDALVASVMLYNSNSWSAPSAAVEKLDVCHRKHLRRILNIYWPKGKITNIELYRRCKTQKLSDRVKKMRWYMFGHILRSDITTPAFTSLRFAVTNNYKSREGRHQCNLFNTLIQDLKYRNIKLDCEVDLENLRSIAFERSRWRSMF